MKIEIIFFEIQDSDITGISITNKDTGESFYNFDKDEHEENGIEIWSNQTCSVECTSEQFEFLKTALL